MNVPTTLFFVMSREPNFVQPRLRFDWTITAGNLISVFGALLIAGAAYTDYKVTIERHDSRIAANELAITSIRNQMLDWTKAQADQTRALDRLTFQLQTQGKP